MEASLYTRLGETEGITRLVDDIIAAHLVNDTIKNRFLPHAADPEHFQVLKDHLAHFLEAGAGGPAAYTGRSMPESHYGLNISAEEYMAAIDDIMQVLEAHGVEESARKDVLAITWSLKGEIMYL